MTTTSPEARLLVVEDETNIRELLATSLKFAGFEVHAAADGQQALSLAEQNPLDLAVMDVMLPDMDGFTVTRRLRGNGHDMPIVFLTARDSVDDKVKGLTVGGDDYVTKPFKPQELVARVRARLRRGDEPEPEKLTIGDLSIDVAGHSVTREGRPISLTPLEFDLLVALARKPWQVFSRETLLEEVWGFDFPTTANSLEVYVGYLRRKTEADGEQRLIHTVRGIGYVLKATEA